MKQNHTAQPCANPECRNMFEPNHSRQICCCHLCTQHVLDQRKSERKHAAAVCHPCKICGEPITNPHIVRCEKCRKAIQEKPHGEGSGIARIDTPAIRKSRLREMEMIEKIVAMALEKERDVNMYRDADRPRLSGVRVA